jgi:MYXO-CTERM domain-containing protein
MKTKTLLVLAGVGAPLIATASADAGFVGLKVVKKIPNPYGILTINVYAEFDNQGNDSFDVAAGTPGTPLFIGVTGGGTFWNRAFGGDTAPSSGLVAVFPSLAFDSFYTIGLKSTTPGVPDVTPLSNMPTLGSNAGPFVTSVFTTNGAWGAVPPTAPQADPWAPESNGGPGQVLIGQFSTTNGTGFYGSFVISFVADGQTAQAAVSFAWPAPGTLALLGLAGLTSTRRRRR